MNVQIELPRIFGKYTNKNVDIKVEGNTIQECIDDMVRQYPDIKKVLINSEGHLGHSYDIFVNGECFYPLDLNMPVKDGDKLNLVLLIYGG